MEGLRCVLTDGASHAVDSSELAFKLAAVYAFRQCYEKAAPVILEPVMVVDVKAPVEFQGVIIGNVNRWEGRGEGEGEGFLFSIRPCSFFFPSLLLLFSLSPS